jgi:hypothetical protein
MLLQFRSTVLSNAGQVTRLEKCAHVTFSARTYDRKHQILMVWGGDKNKHWYEKKEKKVKDEEREVKN